MYARSMLIAAALATATSALAEPARPQVPQGEQPAVRGAEVVLASAENVRVAPVAADPQAPQPAKRRTARVTSCRCAGQPTQEQ